MTEKSFWKLIRRSRKGLMRGEVRQQERLIRRLTRLPLAEIVAFEAFFRHFMTLANTWELRGAAHIVHGGCSDEEFEDFRAWLVARGRRAYYRVLKKPEKLAKLIGPRTVYNWEGFMDCAIEAYFQRTGTEMPSLEELRGQSWQENELPARYPRLWNKFI